MIRVTPTAPWRAESQLETAFSTSLFAGRTRTRRTRRTRDLGANSSGVRGLLQRVVVGDQIRSREIEKSARRRLLSQQVVAGDRFYHGLRESTLGKERSSELDTGDARIHMVLALRRDEHPHRFSE